MGNISINDLKVPFFSWDNQNKERRIPLQNLGAGLSLLSGAVLAGGLVVLPGAASAACVVGSGTVDCTGVFATGIDLTTLQEHKVISLSGVSVDNGGIMIGPDGGGTYDDIDISVVLDETTDGGTISDGGSGAISVEGKGGDVGFMAALPAEGVALHAVESDTDGIVLATQGEGTVIVDSALSVIAGSHGYSLRAESDGSVTGNFRGTIEAGTIGIAAGGEGDVSITVHDSVSDDPEIRFGVPSDMVDVPLAGVGLTDEVLAYAGVFVGVADAKEEVEELNAIDPGEPGSVDIAVADNVRIIGEFHEEMSPSSVHAGIFVRTGGSQIAIDIGDNVTIDPVDFGIYSRSTGAAVLTTIGSGNAILVDDLDEDGVAAGIYAESGALENPEDAAYPHAVAIVTGGNNDINVTGSDPSEFPVSGILAIHQSKQDSTASVLVSLGAYDDGQGNMIGDRITVVGSSENTQARVPGLIGIGAGSLSGVSETIHSVTIETADASAGYETMIVVGDDNADGEDGVSGNGSAGVLALARSGSVNVDLGAYTYIVVVDNDDTIDPPANEVELAALPGGNGDTRSNSYGIYAQSATGGTISVGMNNTIDVTGGHGIYFLSSVSEPDATLNVSIGEGAMVMADYSSLLVDSEMPEEPKAEVAASAQTATIGHVIVENRGSLIGGDDLNVGLTAGQSIEFVNHTGGYIGNELDALAANPDVEAITLQLAAQPSPKFVSPETTDPEMSSETGYAEIVNHGTIVGRINMLGNTVDDDVLEILGDADNLTVAQLTNFGLWNFVGTPVAINAEVTIDNGGTILTVDRNGGGDDQAILGLVQDNPKDLQLSNSAVLEFNNYAWDDGTGAYLPGTLSMVDGETGDLTGIAGAFDGGDYAAGYSGRLALDVHLPGEGDAESDVLLIDTDYLAGSTGIVVNQVGPAETDEPDAKIADDPYAGGLVFTDAAGEAIENACDGYCLSGDAFYIASESANYASVGYDGSTLGLIRDGLGAWVLEETLVEDDGEEPVPDNAVAAPGGTPDLTRYGLVRIEAGPDAYLMPSLITGAQNIWYATDDIVQDQIAGGGGGGVSVSGFGGSAVSSHNYGDGSSIGTNGVWLRATGNWTRQDSTVNDGLFSYDTSFDQDTYSVLAGIDGKIPDSGLRFGLFGGYVNSSLTFTGYGVDSDYEGGTVGAYAALLQGGWRGDLLFKADLLDVSYQSTVGDVDADVTNLGVRANAGYRIEGGQGYIEPLASFAWVNTAIDNMGVGTATVQFSNANSVRAGAGLRVGTEQSLASGGIVALSLTGKLWNEFEDDNTVSITSMAGTDAYTDSIDGLFGEAIATMQYTALNPGLTGLVSVGARFNDDYLSWTARLGLRKSW